jgi:hypothetical protein
MMIVADSSALVALVICQYLHLPEQLFGKIKIPEAVFVEACIPNKPGLTLYAHGYTSGCRQFL